ncbi:hypothetical protein C9374_006162 [Naegleria lovaniensis]|uniref:U3 small nucleolar RNA-associated protein 20 N-terminal domain-containing protein n=1 Tax=Naegleria lovaniensis TaxID=51637 RepID=A0AA88GPG8_NAELO|nr:uncharacterized protein C9374_006162 [Naegleria lovaniensis]KAG2381778.1 hypothetical protein C9374_006162 [Naegleria lovaniensis]
MTERLEKLISLISDFKSDFYSSPHEECVKIRQILIRLFSTSTPSIQSLVLKCLSKFEDLPYLTHSVVRSLSKVINSNRSVQALTKLNFSLPSHVPEKYQSDYVNMLLKVIEPYLLMYDMPKKKGKSGKDKVIKKWKTRVHQVIEFLGELPPNVLKYFIDSLFRRFKSSSSNGTNSSSGSTSSSSSSSTSSNNSNGSEVMTFSEDLLKANTFQLRWLLDIIEEILTCMTGNYSYFYNEVLELLVTIIEMRIEAQQVEMEEDENEEDEEENEEDEEENEEDNEEEEDDNETEETSSTITSTATTTTTSNTPNSTSEDTMELDPMDDHAMTDDMDPTEDLEENEQDLSAPQDTDENKESTLNTTTMRTRTITPTRTPTLTRTRTRTPTTHTTDNNHTLTSSNHSLTFKPKSSKQKVSLTLTFRRAVDLLTLFFERKQEYEFSVNFTNHVVSIVTNFFNKIQDKKNIVIEELPAYFSIIYSWFDIPKLYYLIKYYEQELIYKFIELIDEYNVAPPVFHTVSTF